MTKLAITAVSIALLTVSGIAQADAHKDLEAQIAKLQKDKTALSTRLSNAIAYSKDRAMQIETLEMQATSGQSKRSALNSRLSNAIAFSKERGAQIEMLQMQGDSEKSKRAALSSRLRNAISFSKERGMQLDSEKSKRLALSSRLRNAISFSKERGAQLESEKSKRLASSSRLRNAISFSKERGAQLESEKSKRLALSSRLRNAIAFSKERGAQLESEKSKRLALSSRLRNAIAFSKDRAKQIEMFEQSGAQAGWASGISSSLDSAFGGVQGTAVISNPDNSVKVLVGNNGLFRTGSTILSENGTQLLTTIANGLSATDSNITIVGHTDSIPVGNSNRFSSNEALSFARALSTLQFLRDQGLPIERLSAAGYGASSPIASNDTAEGRQQNRRVEITLRKQ